MGFFSKLLSFGSDKDLKRYQKIVVRINDMEPTYEKMSDAELRAQTERFRERCAAGESLDQLLPEAFATVREASRRTTGLRHFDVQLIGGMALHDGHIAEMKTGEGKTLVSTLAGYLNAIPGTGVHIVTVNDYLARRDSEWMGQIYRLLGLEVGLLQNGMCPAKKRPAYAADITYGTNSEFGFDYLRDNMVIRPERRVQRGHAYAIVDEVDSILIDEARTPLIISGAGGKSASTYKDFARAVRGLKQGHEQEFDMLNMGVPQEPDGDFVMDEAKHTISATEQGLKKIEQRLGIDDIYADLSGQLVNHLQQALKAQYMFHRDQQYVVTNGEVKIVDEFTGRIMEGRRYSEGLHQAIEAKEGVHVKEENQTLATITLQNYFRLYDKLAGMTGTAITEDSEFRETYNLPVEVIPPNKPVIRQDHDDLVYRTIDAKFNAVADDVAERHAAGQPVLVGTVTIESSERLSRTLSKRGIDHEVLNAKNHEREAQIVAQAGRAGAVTIATNMAGRGTDILLGGNPQELALELVRARGIDPAEAAPEVLEAARAEAAATCASEREQVVAAGGLCVIGTERHESRRIDNQLRGRSGRQGDPGETQFYLSLEDDLMRMFGGDSMDRVAAMMVNWDMPDDMPIQHKMITRAVEGAQRKVEDINFSMRKNVLEYDDVMDRQRKVIYAERNKILDGKDMAEHVNEVMADTVRRCVQEFCAVDAHDGERDLEGLRTWVVELTGRQDAPVFGEASYDELCELVLAYVRRCYDEKCALVAEAATRDLEAKTLSHVTTVRKRTLDVADAPDDRTRVLRYERERGFEGKDLAGAVEATVELCVPEFCADADAGDRAPEALGAWAAELAGVDGAPALAAGSQEGLCEQVRAFVQGVFDERLAHAGEDAVRDLNRQVMLRVIDTRWMNYLQEMDYLKTGIGLRGYGQRDPLVEYKTEAYKAFQQLVDTMYEDYLRTVLRVTLKRAPAAQAEESPTLKGASFSGPAQVDGDARSAQGRRQVTAPARVPQGAAAAGGAAPGAGKPRTYRKSEDDNPYVNVGRNEPCPCGSGKKFKYCHGRNQ